MSYLQTVNFTGKVSTDQTGRFLVTSSHGSKYLMVLYDHEIFASAGRSDNETPGLISTKFSCELSRLQVRHLGLDLGFLQRKGWGRHNRRIGDGSGWRSVSVGLYTLSVLVEVSLCCGYTFG